MASLRRRGKFWYIRYRTTDGKQTEVKAGPDKGVAKSIANDLENKVRKVKLGLLDPREAARDEAERIPIATHVKEYVRHVEACGCVPRHVVGVQTRLDWLLEETKIVRLSQLKPSVVTMAFKTLRDAGKADRTVFHYATTIKAFSKWLKKDRRTDGDLLEDLDRPEVITESRRNALTPEQAARLISATRVSKTRRRLSGEDRSWLYSLALVTGLRRSELQSLTPGSFDLDISPPTVFVAAAHTKNSKDATQPLPAHIVVGLRAWLSSKSAHTPLFPPDRNSSLMIKADLKAAGIPSDGFVFHSLRHTYATMVDRCGGSHKDTMELARHANANLTFGTYAHSRLEDLGRVVNNLPDLWAKPWASDRLCDFAHILPTPGVATGLDGSSGNPVNHCPELTQDDPSRHAFQYTRLDSNQ